MATLLYNISQVLGITVIHSLWQAVLIYFLLRIALLPGQKLPASAKYLMGLSALSAITGWFIYTLVSEIGLYDWSLTKAPVDNILSLIAGLPGGVKQLGTEGVRYYYDIEKYLPYVASLYMAGVLFSTGRLIFAKRMINTIRQKMQVEPSLQQLAEKFRSVLHIGKKVTVGLSSMVDVPCMAGYFKPIVLLPLALSTYLSAAEIESILLHELAHVKRGDYLVNIFQQAVAILLFFNPCAILVNRIINEERENCCDDLVVSTIEDRAGYAKALLKIEQNRQLTWKLALAANGKKYTLLNRIQRIMKPKRSTGSVKPAVFILALITISIFSISWFKPELKEGRLSIQVHKPITRPADDTTPKKVAVKKNDTTILLSGKTHDHELKKLKGEVARYQAALNKYLDNPYYLSNLHERDENKAKIDSFFNLPEIKRLSDEKMEIAKAYHKFVPDTFDMKAWADKLHALQAKWKRYEDSTGYVALDEERDKKMAQRDKMNPGSPAYNALSIEINALYDKIAKIMGPEKDRFLEQTNHVLNQYQKFFTSNEAKRMKRQMDSLNEQMRPLLTSEELTSYSTKEREAYQFVEAYLQKPEIKKEQQLLDEAKAKMYAYINSNEFKRKHD